MTWQSQKAYFDRRKSRAKQDVYAYIFLLVMGILAVVYLT